MQPREISNHLDNSCLKFVANRLYYVIRAVSGIKETSGKGENPVKLLHSRALREFQPNWFQYELLKRVEKKDEWQNDEKWFPFKY